MSANDTKSISMLYGREGLTLRVPASADVLEGMTVEALGEIQVPAHTVVPLLVEALGDSDKDVREEAADVLKRLGASK